MKSTATLPWSPFLQMCERLRVRGVEDCYPFQKGLTKYFCCFVFEK